MSGHSKWSTIKHKKGKEDARRGRIFTKLIKEITVAARFGGGDPDTNPRLRTAITTAKNENMPKDNIERAVKKGTGELPGTSYEEMGFEGYGPGGVAVLVEVLTDNKKRAVAEVRHIFSKYNGNLGENGCVGWIFDKKGLIVVNAEAVSEDELMDIALEAGAEDIKIEAATYEVITDPGDFEEVLEVIQAKGVETELAEVTMIPQNAVALEGKKAEQMLKLMEKLEDNDDVQKVYANFDIPDDVLEALGND
jgi:YebC/PmpR family DNA-binding regulatory protein